jgi:hypothetical protein
MIIRNRCRTAFTLVEMLVASALIIFMMFIIASAFEKGLESFRILKVQGDMQEKLRAAATAIRLDLTAQHFGDGSSLSEQRLNNQLWQPPTKGYVRISQPGPLPNETGAGARESVDPDSPTARYYLLTPTAAQNLYLQFTVNLTNGHPSMRDARARTDQFFMTDTTNPLANQQDGTLNQYSAPDYNVVPSSTVGTSFTSYWAEVCYFAKPNGKSTDAIPGLTTAVPLFDLYRRQVLLVEPSPPKPYPLTQPTNGVYNDVSVWPPIGNTKLFNGAADVTEPLRRWGMFYHSPPAAYEFGLPKLLAQASVANPPFPTINDDATALAANNNNNNSPYADPQLGSRVGGDILLTNVVSFEIKVLWEPVRKGGPNTDRFFANANIATPIYPQDGADPTAAGNPDYPFDYLPIGINPGINEGIVGGQSSNPPNPPRIFDTWSSNTDTSIGTPYIYGVDRTKYLDAKGQPVGTQPGLPTDPNFANWNMGHFAPLPGVVPAATTPTNYTIPLRVRVRAIQIKLRIWDQKTSQTRQMTIIQDM